MPRSTNILIAVDVGNSRIKLGRFDRRITRATPAPPEPSEILELPLTDRCGEFDADRLVAWCSEHVSEAADWLVGSVHRGAMTRFEATLANLAQSTGQTWPLRRLTYRDMPIAIEVDAPECVGIDRLLAALAANQLRQRGRAAIVVDLGTAMTVDLVTDAGAFSGGAILPGLAMSARSLYEQTDALPLLTVDRWDELPDALGKSTVPAIESGLFWGAVGAIRELIVRLSAGLAPSPDVFVSGGASQLIAKVLSGSDGRTVRHVPHLVLSGIALVDASGK